MGFHIIEQEVVAMISRPTSSVPKIEVVFPDSPIIIPGVPSLVTGPVWIVVGAARYTECSLQRSEVFPDLSHSLPQYFCTGYH
jgi:hypothetical protein